MIQALSVDRLAGYIDRLGALVREGAAAGATKIVWY